MPTPDNALINQIINLFPPTSPPPLLVGGAVRDFLLSRQPKDLDFLFVGENMAEFEKRMTELASAFHLNTVRPAAFPETLRLVNREYSLDITFVPNGSVIENLLARDFTVNAMALNLTSGEFLDPSDGRKDLEQKKLRPVRENVFEKDPVRIIRLFRFQVELGFRPDETALSLAQKAAPLLSRPAGERLREELFRIIANDGGGDILCQMAVPYLTELFPSLAATIKTPQNGYHHLGVLDHSLAVVSHVFKLKELSAVLNLPIPDFTDEEKIILRLAALFHDVGKADTLSWDENGISTFKNHQLHSVDHFLSDIRRLKPSGRLTERVSLIIRHHMLFLNFMLNGVSEKSFRRLINRLGSDSRLLALLALADKLSAKGPLSAGTAGKMAEIVGNFLKYYAENAETVAKLPKLLSGNEIMKALGIGPSGKVGEILDMITNRQLADPAFNRDRALALLDKIREKQG